MIREGVLVGGPRAGQWMAMDSPWLEVYEHRLDPVGAYAPIAADKIEFGRHRYKWTEFVGVGFWASEDLRDDPQEVFKHLLASYRPNAT
jgi:hypothetical protein